MSRRWTAAPGSGFSFSDPNEASPSITFIQPASYTVTVVASNSSGSNSFSRVIEVTDCGNLAGIADVPLLQDQVSIQPNPTSGELQLWLGSFKAEIVTVKLFNNLGQLLFQRAKVPGSDGRITLNLEEKQQGIYTLSVESAGQKSVKRVVISR